MPQVGCWKDISFMVWSIFSSRQLPAKQPSPSRLWLLISESPATFKYHFSPYAKSREIVWTEAFCSDKLWSQIPCAASDTPPALAEILIGGEGRDSFTQIDGPAGSPPLCKEKNELKGMATVPYKEFLCEQQVSLIFFEKKYEKFTPFATTGEWEYPPMDTQCLKQEFSWQPAGVLALVLMP